MPKIKTCPHCNAELVCARCGMRVTPDLVRKPGRKAMNFKLSGETEEQLRQVATVTGATMTEVVETAIEMIAKTKSTE